MLLVVSLTVAFCVSASAVETITASGFYDIGSAKDVSILPLVSGVGAESAAVDVDGDEELDVLYIDSNRLTVKYSAATIGVNYGVVLSIGTSLPASDSDIIYINQVKAETNTVTFDVYPILPEEETDLMLYISSGKEDEVLVSVPLKYTTRDTFVIPVDYITGDINGDETVDIKDAVCLFQYSMLPDVYPIAYPGEVDFIVDGNVDIKDAVRLFQYSMMPDVYPIG